MTAPKPYEIISRVRVGDVDAARKRLTREFGSSQWLTTPTNQNYEIWKAPDGRVFNIVCDFAPKRGGALFLFSVCEIRITI